MRVFMKPGERLDSLSYQGLRILQRPDAFRFGTDAVLLADFAGAKPGDRVVDLGTGTGIVAILMASRQPRALFEAVELQEEMADMAARSVELNHLESQIRVRHCDIREAASVLGYGNQSLAVCNPPYGKAGAALVNPEAGKRVARHEEELTPDELARCAFALLKTGGRLALIYPAPRILELMCALRERRMEPKRIRTVHARPEKPPKLVLLDAVKGGGSMLHWLPPLYLGDAEGRPSAEWRRIYRCGEDADMPGVSAGSFSCERLNFLNEDSGTNGEAKSSI